MRDACVIQTEPFRKENLAPRRRHAGSSGCFPLQSDAYLRAAASREEKEINQWSVTMGIFLGADASCDIEGLSTVLDVFPVFLFFYGKRAVEMSPSMGVIKRQ